MNGIFAETDINPIQLFRLHTGFVGLFRKLIYNPLTCGDSCCGRVELAAEVSMLLIDVMEVIVDENLIAHHPKRTRFWNPLRSLLQVAVVSFCGLSQFLH